MYLILQGAWGGHFTCFSYNPSARVGLAFFVFFVGVFYETYFWTLLICKHFNDYGEMKIAIYYETDFDFTQTCHAFDNFSCLSFKFMLGWNVQRRTRMYFYVLLFKKNPLILYSAMWIGCFKWLCLASMPIISQGLYFVVWRDLMLKAIESTFVISGNWKSRIYSGVTQIWQGRGWCKKEDSKWHYHLLCRFQGI